MPKQARDYNYNNYSNSNAPISDNMKTQGKIYQYPYANSTRISEKRKKKNPFRFIFSCFIIFGFLLIFMPFAFSKVTKSIFVPIPYKNIKTDLYKIAFPSTNYLANNWFLDRRKFSFSSNSKDAEMISIREGVNIPSLEQSLYNLIKEYPMLKPSIYVWDYQTQNYADINASEIYPVASIIKIPILIDLFKSIENGSISLDDTIQLTEYYRTEGSGSLQFKASNTPYSIDKLAEIMITESDNSATNMLLSKIGGMPELNQSIRDWGLKHTEIETWLPDMGGTNHSTAKEMAQMLYNIDLNENFLTDASRNKIFSYMSHVHNNRLIQAGLGEGSIFYHKTGDIGKMLGDAGIVVTPGGKRYLVVIFSHRPHNDFHGKEFIVKASELIYNYMVK